MEKSDLLKHLQGLKNKWPSAIVARTEVKAFSGGALNSGTCANLDCLGEGPEKFRIGRKVCYPVDGLIEWMVKRSASV